MHLAAIILIALAGIHYCAAALVRWRIIGRLGTGHHYLYPLAVGMALHTASLLLSLGEGGHRTFAFAVIALWAAVASLFFLGRFLLMPSKWLLVLPVGGMALLVAGSAAAGRPAGPPPDGEHRWIVLLHVVFMAGHLVAALVAGAAGILYLVAARRLQSADPTALRLPTLPVLDRLDERALVTATALLIGGLATGGAAMQVAEGFNLLHPTALIALATMALLVTGLGARLANTVGRRGLAAVAVATLALNGLAMASLLLGKHG